MQCITKLSQLPDKYSHWKPNQDRQKTLIYKVTKIITLILCSCQKRNESILNAKQAQEQVERKMQI